MEIKKDICLKNIIKEKFDEYDEKSSLIFTTYEYDNTFFETQLLPFLFDTEKYVRLQNRSKLIAHELDLKLNKINLKVFYNHFKGDYQANINFKSFENPTSKLLHSKIIIIIGKKNKKKKMTIILSSANLTTSSYGTNLETVGTIQNDDENIINEIEDTDSLMVILKALNKIKEVAITGIEKENKIENELNNSKKISIITPFLEEKIVNNYKNTSSLNVIFTNLRGLKNKDKYKEYDFIKVYPRNERKIHSKIYLLDGKKVIVGSHNFTTSAIKGDNIEASLICEYNELYKGSKEFFDNIYDKCLEISESIDNEINELSQNEIKIPKYFYVSKAEIDWKNEKLSFEITPKSDEKYTIKSIRVKIGKSDLKWINVKFDDNKKSWNIEKKITEKITDDIFENKFYNMTIELIHKKTEELQGILYEKDPIDKLYTIKGRNFNDILNPIYLNNVAYIDEEIDTSLNDTLENRNNSFNEDVEAEAYNITDMFLAFDNLNGDINEYIKYNQDDKIKDFYITDKEFYITDVKRSKSIKRLSYLFNDYYKNEENIEKNKRKILYYLLTCNELRLLWNKDNKVLRKLKTDKEVDNIIKNIEKNFKTLKMLALNLIKENNEISKTIKEPKRQEDLLNIFLNKF